EADVGRVRLPAVVDRDALVELVRHVAGPVAGCELQHRRRHDARAVERAAAAQHLREAKQIRRRRYAADPWHLRVLFLERTLRTEVAAAEVLLRRLAAKIREYVPRREILAQSD